MNAGCGPRHGKSPNGIATAQSRSGDVDAFPKENRRVDGSGVFPGVDSANADDGLLSHNPVAGRDGEELLRGSGGDGEPWWVDESDPLVVAVWIDDEQERTVGCREGRRLPICDMNLDNVAGFQGSLSNAQIEIVMPRVEVAAELIPKVDRNSVRPRQCGVVWTVGIVGLRIAPVERPPPSHPQTGAFTERSFT